MWFSTFGGAGSQCVPRRPHGLTNSLGSCDQGHTVENPCWQAHTVWPSLSMRVAQATPRTLVDGKIVPRPSRGCPGTKSILFHGILMEKRWVFDPRPCCCCWSWTIIVISCDDAAVEDGVSYHLRQMIEQSTSECTVSWSSVRRGMSNQAMMEWDWKGLAEALLNVGET